jgi:hypothetical protein
MGRAEATSAAASVGRALAIVAGVLAVLSMGHNPFWMVHVGLAIFVYTAGRAEEMQVLAQERRRQFTTHAAETWAAPPGYRWVHQGNGIWVLSPSVIRVGEGEAIRWPGA